MGEAIANETQATLLDVLLDWIEWLLLGDLELCVGPTRDLDNHVEDAIALVGKKRDVVEWGDDGSILFRIDAMFWRRADESTGMDVRETIQDVPKVLGAPTTRVENSGVMMWQRRNEGRERKLTGNHRGGGKQTGSER